MILSLSFIMKIIIIRPAKITERINKILETSQREFVLYLRKFVLEKFVYACGKYCYIYVERIVQYMIFPVVCPVYHLSLSVPVLCRFIYSIALHVYCFLWAVKLPQHFSRNGTQFKLVRAYRHYSFRSCHIIFRQEHYIYLVII